jgi:hypothetical protein
LVNNISALHPIAPDSWSTVHEKSALAAVSGIVNGLASLIDPSARVTLHLTT